MKYYRNFDELPAVLTVGQVAILLQYTAEYVQRLCKSGSIPSTKVGKEYRILKTDLFETLSRR